jgi:hypothetical protein
MYWSPGKYEEGHSRKEKGKTTEQERYSSGCGASGGQAATLNK